jgi:hypothetical protein
MPKPSESYNLHVLRPDLAKDWHPTKNGTMGPKDVTPGSRKKVWWLCEHGHWWLASVAARVKGMQCSYCRQIRKASPRLLANEKPELLKEWHPSKNKGIKARDVSCTHSEKIWWLCTNGHEWQATIRSRLSEKGCPFCSSVAHEHFIVPLREKGPASAPQGHREGNFLHRPLNQLNEQVSAPPHGKELRRSKRYVDVATVMIESTHAGIFGYGQMNNYSATGMLIRSDFPIRPGTFIKIRLEKPLYSSESNVVDSRVVWCKPVEDDNGRSSRFGIGVRLI